MSRWVRINTDTTQHPMFENEQRSKHDAWIWLIQNAAWKDTQFDVRGTLHPVPKGSMFTTIRILMDKWKWGNTKTVNFLAELERQGMITQDNKTGKTFISVCNYRHYQTPQDSDKTPARHPQDTRKTQKEPIKPNNNTTLLGDREFDLYDAAGNEDPRLALNLSEPLNWLANGCDFDLDIIPAIKHMATKSKITNWQYCRGRVFQNRDTRLAPAPEPTAPIHSQGKPMGIAEMALHQSRQLAEQGR